MHLTAVLVSVTALWYTQQSYSSSISVLIWKQVTLHKWSTGACKQPHCYGNSHAISVHKVCDSAEVTFPPVRFMATTSSFHIVQFLQCCPMQKLIVKLRDSVLMHKFHGIYKDATRQLLPCNIGFTERGGDWWCPGFFIRRWIPDARGWAAPLTLALW